MSYAKDMPSLGVASVTIEDVLICVDGLCYIFIYTRWFKYDRDDLCVNKSQFVPVIFKPPCILYITLS